jgi:hypothetical protein
MVAASREMVGICREVVTSKKRMHEIISSWASTENLCMFISIVRQLHVYLNCAPVQSQAMGLGDGKHEIDTCDV